MREFCTKHCMAMGYNVAIIAYLTRLGESTFSQHFYNHLLPSSNLPFI